MHKTIITCLLAGFLSSAFADSAIMFEFPDGQTVGLTSSGDISMAAESVYIVPSYGNFERGNHIKIPMMQVRCVFQLVNNTDHEQNITVGFPIDDRFGDLYRIIDPNDETNLWWERTNPYEEISPDLNFKTLVNGEEIPVFYRNCAGSSESELGRPPIAAVWKMKFEAGETVTLENTYNTSWDLYSYDGRETFTVNYILTTGATWSGPIENAVIVLEVPEELPFESISDSLYTYWDWSGSPVISNRTITWHYTDLEPEENISFSVKHNHVSGHISHYDGLSAVSANESITWTEEALLETAIPFIRDGIGYTPATEFSIPIIETILYVICGQQPPNREMVYIFNDINFDSPQALATDLIGKLEVVHLVKASIEENESVVSETGYIEFLPLFCSNIDWEDVNLARYAADQERQERFLTLLEYQEAAAEGEQINNLPVRAFYELVGWYIEGTPSERDFLPEETVRQYRENSPY